MLTYFFMISTIRKNIENNIRTFIKKVKKDYPFESISPTLYEAILEFSLRKGKRIRPLLFILSYKGYCPVRKKIPPSLYYGSTSIELLHNFMLIHDDIIDRSDLRRGKPTLHKILEKTVKTKEKEKLGCDLGIVAGDIIYALSIESFLSIQESPQKKERALKYFVQTAAFTAMGEFLDTIQGMDRLKKVEERHVFLNYNLKTARYTFMGPLIVGATLAGADQKEITKLSKFGQSLGQAFQIQDDIIGMFDSQKSIGKSILSDLAESKKTLLVAHAYKHLKTKNKKLFVEIFNKPKKTYTDLLTMRRIFLQTKSLDYCMQQIKTRLNSSSKIFETLKMNSDSKNAIKDILFNLFRHSHRIAEENKINIEFSFPSTLK